MTKRENLLRLLSRKGYDEVPFGLNLCPEQIEVYRQKTGGAVDYEAYFGLPLRDLPYTMPADVSPERYAAYYPDLAKDTFLDWWGVGHRTTPDSVHDQMLHPLAMAEDEEEIENYPLPVFTEEGNGHIAEAAKALKSQGIAAVGNLQMTVWETSWYIRGMENLMMDMASEDPMADALLSRIEASAVARAEIYARAGADILFLGDDVGMQKTVMMSEALYCTWIKPRLARVIAAAKCINPDILIFYHSCGYIEPFIPHLIEAGVEVLNPIQPESMNFAHIHSLYGDKISFYGTIGTQTTLPFGSTAEVKEAVKKHLDIAGPAGGLLIAPTHVVEPDVPWENLLAFVEACREYKVQ